MLVTQPASIFYEQYAASEPPTACGNDGNLVRCNLSLAAAPPELGAGFMNIAQAVCSPTGQLAAVGVQRQLAVAGDTMTTFHEATAFTSWAKAKCLEPDQCQDRKTVVQLSCANVFGFQIRACPHHFTDIARGSGGEIDLIPGPWLMQCGSDCLEADGWVRAVTCCVNTGQHDSSRSVAMDVAIKQPQRTGDHSRGKVVVKRERAAVDRFGVERSVF